MADIQLIQCKNQHYIETVSGLWSGINIIIIIIIQYLYSVLQSCKGYRGAGGFWLRLSKQVCFEVFLKVCAV